MEEWRDIADYEGFYQVSNTGKVRSIEHHDRFGRLYPQVELMPATGRNGYLMLHLKAGGHRKMVLIHRLVARAFIPNPKDYTDVNHIDGDKTNNDVSNLEWCTHSYNQCHAYATGLNHGSRKLGVDVIRDDGVVYHSYRDAALANHTTHPTIRKRCLDGKAVNGHTFSTDYSCFTKSSHTS